MAEINTDYSSWSNQKAIEIAKKVDKDGVKGLNSQEIFSFTKEAISNNMEKDEIFSLLGLSVNQSNSAKKVSEVKTKNSAFNKAVDYYNNEMSSYQRYQVTTNTYTKLEERLYKMEKAIDNAFQQCDAYKDIIIMPRWHYRYYPYFDDKLINFDINELREVTTRDMNSLQELKDNVERVIENANGITTHTTPEKTSYDIEAMAQKHLGMSYSEFAKKYKKELDFCKTVTAADLYSMTPTQRMVYSKAKAYAKEMLQTTINEAHNVNWDTGERKTQETLKATGDMYTISEFEEEGITDSGLKKIQSGIMYKAFEETLIEMYNTTDIDNKEAVLKTKQSRKAIVNGQVLIFNPDGSVYNTLGKRIK